MGEHDNGERRPLDAMARALVPIVTFWLILLLGCVDALMVSGTEPVMGSSDVASSISLDVIPEGALGEEGLTLEAPPLLVVRISRRGSSRELSFGVDGAYRIFSVAADDPLDGEHKLLAAGANLGQVHARARGDEVVLNGRPLPGPTILVRPTRSGDLDIAGTRYRGALLLSAEKGDRLTASNFVEVEAYVAGVLLSEMPARFGQEALRAQAVVARTFALFQARAGKTLRDDQRTQVYAGMRKEDDEVLRIVRSTVGEVLTFEGELLESFFHSTCGGVTSSAAGVFGIKRPAPLNGGVACQDCRNSPHYQWRRSIPLTRLSKLYGGSFGSGLVLEVESSLPSGRAETVVIRDRSGKKQDRLVADRFRSNFNSGRPLKEQLPSMFIQDIVRSGDSLEITGRGFGHGVGLCQYGAGGMARRRAGYRQILSRYYPGAVVSRIYD